MAIFKIRQRETWYHDYDVEADSVDEALEIVENGELDDDEGILSFGQYEEAITLGEILADDEDGGVE